MLGVRAGCRLPEARLNLWRICGRFGVTIFLAWFLPFLFIHLASSSLIACPPVMTCQHKFLCICLPLGFRLGVYLYVAMVSTHTSQDDPRLFRTSVLRFYGSRFACRPPSFQIRLAMLQPCQGFAINIASANTWLSQCGIY